MGVPEIHIRHRARQGQVGLGHVVPVLRIRLNRHDRRSAGSIVGGGFEGSAPDLSNFGSRPGVRSGLHHPLSAFQREVVQDCTIIYVRFLEPRCRFRIDDPGECQPLQLTDVVRMNDELRDARRPPPAPSTGPGTRYRRCPPGSCLMSKRAGSDCASSRRMRTRISSTSLRKLSRRTDLHSTALRTASKRRHKAPSPPAARARRSA